MNEVDQVVTYNLDSLLEVVNSDRLSAINWSRYCLTRFNRYNSIRGINYDSIPRVMDVLYWDQDLGNS